MRAPRAAAVQPRYAGSSASGRPRSNALAGPGPYPRDPRSMPAQTAAARTGYAGSSATRWRRPGSNAPARQAIRIAMAVIATMIVEIALISGVTPNFILP